MSKKDLKICFIFGTRPEIIKLYSVMNAAIAHEQVTPLFVHTGQHYDYEMSQVFLEELQLPDCNYFLNVKSGSHGQQTGTLLTAIEDVLKAETPDVTAVVGDTNTVLAGALVGAKLQIPVAHVEAGCRSFDLDMPEEINRLVADAVSSILFAPSYVSALNLLFEGKAEQQVIMAGNTVVDIVEETASIRKSKPLPEKLRNLCEVVITLHRQENVDDKKRLSKLLQSLTKIPVPMLFPIHPRTKKRIEEFNLEHLIESNSNLHIVKPLNYLTFMKALETAKVVITDSGGVQEEAIMLGTPCVTARDTTEWPETVWAGGNQLAGLKAENVAHLTNELLQKSASSPLIPTNPFKGNAGPTIINKLVELWSKGNLKPEKPNMESGKYPLPWILHDSNTQEEFYTSLRFSKEGKPILESKNKADTRVIRRLRSWDKLYYEPE